MKRLFSIILTTIWAFVAISQNDSTAAFAEEKYKAQNYYEAINAYEEIVENGIASAELYYNLGNAYYKMGELPKAILYYEKAILLSPTNNDIEHNLALAYSQQPDNIEHLSLGFIPRAYQFLYRLGSVDMWAILSILFLVLLCIGLCIFLFSQIMRWRKISLTTIIVSFVFGITTFCFANSRNSELTAQEFAIVIEPTTNIKTEPMTTATDLATIHGGIKVRIIDEAFGWFKVALGNGNVGWILAENIERI